MSALRGRVPPAAAGLWPLAILPEAGVWEATTDAALILLVGGLSMLLVIATLVFLQNLLPDRRSRAHAAARAPPGRELRPIGPGDQPMAAPAPSPRRPPGHAPRPPLDGVMELLVQRGVGEPRILRSYGGFTLVRIYRCRSCLDRDPPRDGAGCPSEREALERAFREVFGRRARARETACLRNGAAACEFKVVR